MNYTNEVTEIEEFLRLGHAYSAEKRLQEIDSSTLPDLYRHQFASLYRRICKPEAGLKCLKPLIEKSQTQEIDDSSIIEYSLCLFDVGASNEALHFLNRINVEKTPQALVYQMHVMVAGWRYAESIAVLKKYLQHSDIDLYQQAVAKLNLASAYVFVEDFNRAKKLTEQLIKSSEKQKWVRLLINSYEVKAHALLYQGDLEGALRAIDLALENAISSSLIDRFFLDKWRAIICGLQNSDTQELLKIRKDAEQRKYWESLRVIDFFIFKINGDKDLINKLFFGTPYSEYRQKLKRHADLLSEEYYFPKKEKHVVDLNSGRLNNTEVLPVGKKIHQLVAYLVSDFYTPVTIGNIFNHIFSQESYDPLTSPDRVHQLILRCRNWFKQKKLGFEISCIDGQYQLATLPGWCLKKQQSQVKDNHQDARIEQLKQFFKESPFSSAQAIKELELSRSNVNRLLKKACEEGALQVKGTGKATRYFFE